MPRVQLSYSVASLPGLFRLAVHNVRIGAIIVRVAQISLCCGFMAGARAQSDYSTPYSFSTLAGVVTTLASGHVSVLEFESTSVHGMAFDSAGNRLETKGHAIQRTSADGTTTTIAGSPPVGYEGGYADGPAGLAKFDLPRGLTVDVTGNIIVADTDNNVVRKVSLGGEVITLAGMPVPIARGSADGVGGAARFHSPAGIGIAPTGEIYLADPGNYTVREITLQGSVTTLAGTAGRFGTTDGTGGAAQFRYPTGITVDLQGNVFVADEFFSIRKIATDGSVVTLVALTAVRCLKFQSIFG